MSFLFFAHQKYVRQYLGTAEQDTFCYPLYVPNIKKNYSLRLITRFIRGTYVDFSDVKFIVSKK